MDIRVNLNNVRELVGRLKKSFLPQEVSQSACYEGLAHLAGLRDWDTLSGVLKAEAEKAQVDVKEDSPETEQALPMSGLTIFLPAFCTDEFGDSPDWAMAHFSPKLLREVRRLQELCRTNKLAFLAISHSVNFWQNQDEHRIYGEDLYISERDLWFRGLPKHVDYAVETRAFNLNKALEVAQGKSTSTYYAVHNGCVVFAPSGDVESFVSELEDAGAFEETSADEE